jgi:hypothetical protein
MTTANTGPDSTTQPSKGLGIGLWIVQGLLALTFVGTGLWKLATPVPCAALMASAVVFHFSRGEGANTWFNFLLAALALFVAWGRRTKAPIAPRG